MATKESSVTITEPVRWKQNKPDTAKSAAGKPGRWIEISVGAYRGAKTDAYGLELSFHSPAQRDEAIAVLQNLPELHHELRQRSISSAIGFLEDKPEIYHHDSLAFHLLGNARLRNQFMREVGALTSQEVAELGQSQAKNRAAHAHRVKTENKIFAVEYQGDDRYPAFQFDLNTGKPKPVIKQMLETVKGQWSGWQLALWCATPNGYLDDKAPMECLDETPDKVLDALRGEAGEVEF